MHDREDPGLAEIGLLGLAVVREQTGDMLMPFDEAGRPPRRHQRIDFTSGQQFRQRCVVPRRQRKAVRQVQGKLVATSGDFQAALNPLHVLDRDAVFVAQEPPEPHDGGHLIFGDADALSTQVLRTVDAAVGADIDRRVAEHPRQEHRDRYIGRDPARQRDQIRTEPDFGDLELAMKEGAFEAFLDRHGEMIDGAALDRHPPVLQRARAIVVPGRDRQR